MMNRQVEDAEVVVWNNLEDAIRANDLAFVTEILRSHPSLIYKVWCGSLLHLASETGRPVIVEYLLDMGAEININDEIAEVPPVTLAAGNGHVAIVRLLIGRGAQLDASPGINPLIAAITDGHLEVCKVLLDAGFDANYTFRSVTGKLKNALSHATNYGHGEIVELLKAHGCRLPIEGVDIPAVDLSEGDSEPTPLDLERDELVELIAAAVGAVDPLAQQELLPVHDAVRISVHVIRPSADHPCLTLFTTGMSHAAMTTPAGQEEWQYAELIMHLPASWPHPRDASTDSDLWPAQWLRQLAYFPHLQDSWLGGMTTIVSSAEPPQPLGPNTTQSCLLLAADFDPWSPVVLRNGKRIHFYTVVPIYTEERDFEKQHGIVSLLQQFFDRGFTTVVDLHRANVVSK